MEICYHRRSKITQVFFVDIAIIFGLILLNGVFAMSEIAIVSSKRLRLQQAADNGDQGAKKALELSEEPTRFLSTIQVGITLIGIMAGAFGEAAIVQHLEAFILDLGLKVEYAKPVAWTSMVVIITYFSLIFGELVPKRLALMNPELIARIVSRPMDLLSKMVRPLVWLLSHSTELILKLLRARRQEEVSLIEEEIHSLIKQGAETGVLDLSEKNMVKNVLRLDDKRVGNVMTLREDLFYIDLNDGDQANLAKINSGPYFWVPVCRGGLNQIVGMLSVKDLLSSRSASPQAPLESLVQSPLYVPLSTTLLELLEQFKQARDPVVLVRDHHGQVAGLVTMSDVMMAIVGDFPVADDDYEPDFVQRQDGSWLVSGQIDIATFKDHFAVRKLPEESSGLYHTLGGLLLTVLDRVPKEADAVLIQNLRLEVVDMDGARVDKVLVCEAIAQEESRTSTVIQSRETDR
ncbi:CBS domain protein, hemolysin-related [gamma proteobacterium HdN1]|nr:CBS domain protein, hemolysin-related [gamma proteobacterium HdN1]